MLPGGPGLQTSIAILIGAFAVAAFANWQLRRDYLHRIRGVPWFAVQFVFVAILLTMAAHIISLLTGIDMPGRGGGY